jgi:hypothetical protein
MLKVVVRVLLNLALAKGSRVIPAVPESCSKTSTTDAQDAQEALMSMPQLLAAYTSTDKKKLKKKEEDEDEDEDVDEEEEDEDDEEDEGGGQEGEGVGGRRFYLYGCVADEALDGEFLRTSEFHRAHLEL